jgi:hypothetical protein
MTKDEALQIALEALEGVLDDSPKVLDASISGGLYEVVQCRDAITAIKAAIEAKDEPHGWKLVPIEPTDEMLKAMDECSTEGYDERLYAGYAASVYMAAVDVAPTPPQRTWVGLMRGVRVEGNAVVITVKGGNDEARALCGELINEMEKNT